MKRFLRMKPILGLMLVLSLVATSVAPVTAVNAEQEAAVTRSYEIEKVDNSLVKKPAADLTDFADVESETQFADDDMVRVSIVLDGTSVIDAGYSTEELASNEAALELIEEVYEEQKSMEEKIDDALGEGTLDVQWNLAVAANIISADVTYKDIAAIAEVEGVKEVIIEAKYLPCSPAVSDDPDMVISSNTLTGVTDAWAKGQTGAGGRIAIIDTGLDIYHQSFDNDAFLYALKEDAYNSLNFNFDNYLKKIDLLDAADIEKVLPLLNAYASMGEEITAEDFVISEKIPYAFNYVDSNTNVEHIYDNQGEHGSHVSGIAAANRYLKTEDGYVDALETVYVAGNAPDAQIIVMKVFGQGGGAYDSDYMAAIEDAILLGADSVNLSLGSAAPGFTTSSSYQEIMDKLTSTDTVVVMSAGNSGSWADNTYTGLLYNDDVSYNTAGSPGSFTNSLGVASVDNYGLVSKGITVGESTFAYSESATYGNKELATLCGDQASVELEYVFIDGKGEEADFEGLDLNGKVFFCSRGAINFATKANNAASNGAAATIIYNNTTGSIGLNLTGYEYTAPCVSITQDAAAAIRAMSESKTTDGGVEYFTGKITISADLQPILSNAKTLTMSSFSSWGVPGDLSIKPEITAPGGSIYSVAGSYDEGGGNDQYELMSGTSMAAPQITGMMAVLKRYVETTWYKKFPSISHRALAQSLLMSTASPIVGESGERAFMYSVLKQGAGLANVNDAMNAATFVMMDENATKSYADGKIKAELGDDPEKTGEYKFSFTLTNMTGLSHAYKLSDYVFTQGLTSDGYDLYNPFEEAGNDDKVLYLTDETVGIDAEVTYYVDGKNVSNAEDQINPYTADLEAAQKALAAADKEYNDAVEKAAAANVAVAEAWAKQAEAAVNLTAAQAELTAAKLKEALAKARRKFVKNGEKLYQQAVTERKNAEKKVSTAKTALSKANTAAKKAETAASKANKPVTAALKKVTAAQSKVADLKVKEAAWVPSVIKDGVVVGPNKEAKVEVVIKLTDETKETLDTYFPAGAYIEAYISAESQDDTSSHSIPVLAFYGNWTDPSMFDKGSYMEYFYGVETRAPYLYEKNKTTANTFWVYDAEAGMKKPVGFTGLGRGNSKLYKPLYYSMNNENGSYIDNVTYALIRNAAARAVIISDAKTGEIYEGGILGSQLSAYYSANAGSWYNTSSKISIGWKGTDAEGNPLPEGTMVGMSLVAAPEYNVKEDGSIDWASLGEGAYLTTYVTIDNTAPELVAVSGSKYGYAAEDEEKDTLIVSAADNFMIAGIDIYDGTGEYLGSYPIGKQSITTLLPDEYDANVYFISAYDYAGNTSTYRVFLKVEPTYEVESIGLDKEEIALVKNNTTRLTATLAPVTLEDNTVTWSTTDETVATVDENGIVTAVGEGECQIIATANADETKQAACDVTVISIECELDGFVWDENGRVWLAALDTANVPEYVKLMDAPDNLPFNATAWDMTDGNLFATTLDTSEGVSSLYSLDLDTLEFSKIGDSVIAYFDMAEAPNTTGLMGVYYNYIVLIDPETGDYVGAFNYASSNLVGITYIGSVYNSYYGKYIDMYYLLDDEGNLYLEAFIALNGKYYYFNGSEDGLVGATGITADTEYFQSLYHNGEYLFASNFVEADNCVNLYAIDIDNTGAVFNLGSYADGVWPVAGLCELTNIFGYDNDSTEALENAEVKAEASIERIQKIDTKAINK